MYLYEKNKDKIDVYELKARRDKLFDFKRREMEQKSLDNIVFSLQSNNKDELIYFYNSSEYTKDFIDKKNKVFKHKRGIKLDNVIHFSDDGLKIDGLLYRLFRGDFDYPGFGIKKVINKDKKYLLLTDYIEENKTKVFDAESYKYSIDNVISIPESIYLLKKVIMDEFEDILDKNIDEQLSLFDFTNEPIKRLDFETAQFLNMNYVTDNRLEIDQNILKKVRQINK